MENRRRNKRVAMGGPCIFRTAKAEEGKGECCNVSSSGILFHPATPRAGASGTPVCASPEVPPAGSDLWIYFKLAGHQFVAAGTAARTTERHCAVQFAETPRGLAETLVLLDRDDRRAAQRVGLEATVRIRRQSGQMEVVPVGDISQAGFYFESTQFYSIGEKVFAVLRYRADSPDEALPEVPALIARATALHTWGAFSYGARFIAIEP